MHRAASRGAALNNIISDSTIISQLINRKNRLLWRLCAYYCRGNWSMHYQFIIGITGNKVKQICNYP